MLDLIEYWSDVSFVDFKQVNATWVIECFTLAYKLSGHKI